MRITKNAHSSISRNGGTKEVRTIMILRLGSLQRELSIQDGFVTTSRLLANRSGCQPAPPNSRSIPARFIATKLAAQFVAPSNRIVLFTNPPVWLDHLV